MALLLLGLAAYGPKAWDVGQSERKQAMATKSGTDTKSDAAAPTDTIITPAGPRLREKVREVKPGEAVRRNDDGSLSIEPAQTSKDDETPSAKSTGERN